MKQTKTPREWYEEHVNKGELLDSIVKAMADAVREGSTDIDGGYLGLVSDIISGSSGRYIPFYALEYFDYDIDVDNIEQYDFEEVIDELYRFTVELEDIINSEVINGTEISVHFGYWESDGAYCMMAYISEEGYQNHLEQFENFMSGGGMGH